ncbi:MAG: prolyl oligopeptidase family serine peptidase [Anaerolineae bacterium]|nr:MAG: prolyl oligopeptidase family serine peptidase [Anaerolineae bacterium]
MTMKRRYPYSRREEILEEFHGRAISDPYRWLEDIDSAETAKWIADQNEVTFDYLGKIENRKKIADRMVELWDYEKFGTPTKRGGRYFFTHNDGLQNQSVLYWLESLEDEPKMLIDPNKLSDDGTVAMISFVPSKDGKLLAYGLTEAGSDWQTWRVRDVGSGQNLVDTVEWVKFSVASWSHDGLGFFYSRYDEPKSSEVLKGANYYQKLFYHAIGTPQSEDKLIYHRPDQKEWGFSGEVSHDGRYLIITVFLGTQRETGIFYLDLLQAGSDVIELLKDFDASYTFIGNDDDKFFFMSDLEAPLSRVIAIDLKDPERENWQTVIPEARDSLQSITMSGECFIASYLYDAHSKLTVFDRNGKNAGEIDLPGLGTVVAFNGWIDDDEAFYSYSSFNRPITIFRYDVRAGESTIFREPVLSFDPDKILTRQLFFESKDGTQIPMFVSHHKDVKPGPETPLYLYGYGGFNIALTPQFSTTNLVWMEMGGIFVQVNLRGGAEYGKAWHEAGMKLQKQNVFDDFIAAAEYLITNEYTSTQKLAIGGHSNGGLLVGACLTQRPDLYGGCLLYVGVLDMLRFHKFTIGWAWTSDYGSPDDPQEFEALAAYSPYHNLTAGTTYPATLILTGDHDDRVYPAHSFKFAAALQYAQNGDGPTLIRIDTDAGHGLGKPTEKVIDESSDGLAFLSRTLGMNTWRDV